MNEKDNLASTSRVPRPGIRLGLTFVLGLLGTYLMPIQSGFFPGVLAAHHDVALLVWLVAAFAGVLLIHREEHVQTPARLFIFMVLALAVALVRTPPADIYDILDRFDLAKISAIGLLLLMAGALVFGLPVQGGRRRSWIVYLLRGPALAIASPLLLFASRPRGGRPFSLRSALSRTAFLILLYALVSPLLSLGRDYYPSALWRCVNVDELGLLCLSFSPWAWFGCALLFLLSPWPEVPKIMEPDNKTRVHRIRFLASIGLTAIALVLLAVLRWEILIAVVLYSLLFFFIDWLPLALLYMVCPCLRYPRLPKLGELPPEARVGPLGTLLFMALMLFPCAFYFRPAIRTMVKGKLFASTFDARWVEWALDQSTIQCGFWRFTAMAGIILPFVAIARWLSNRSTRRGYWAFTAPTVALLFCLLSYLTCVFVSLIMYIHTLGFTPLRIYGLAYGVVCYVVTLVFLRWSVRSPCGK